MAYKLTLTDEEYEAIRFVTSRGYCEKVWEAINHTSTTSKGATPNGGGTYEIPEHMVWEIQEEQETNGGHHFGPVSEELTAKLIDGIV